MKKLLILMSFIMLACEPMVDTISEERQTEDYTKTGAVAPPAKDTLLVMTWNIRFGIASQIPWFGDACGNRSILTRAEVTAGLDGLIAQINKIKPDVLLLQEVDVKCKRTAYIDEMKYIMDHTYFGYGVYATNWKTQFIASDGLGRMDEGNSILSRWPITEHKLIPLPLRTDQDALTKYFFIREVAHYAKIKMPNGTEFYAVNTHLSAFATDDTKKRQLSTYAGECLKLAQTGLPLVTGGDFNLIPPVSDKTDFCDADKCPGEHFHSPGDDPQHKPGSNYAPELSWVNPMYDSFQPSLSLNEFKANQQKYFTCGVVPISTHDRTLDYLFCSTGTSWIGGSHKAWQELILESDHVPVTALWRIK